MITTEASEDLAQSANFHMKVMARQKPATYDQSTDANPTAHPSR